MNRKSFSTTSWHLALLLFVCGVGASKDAYSAPCDDPLRLQDVCYKMRTLRSQIDILDSQRDLFQINFPLFEAVALDMKELSLDVSKSYPSAHLAALKEVSDRADFLQREARTKDTHSLVTANTFRAQCLSCHSDNNPSSGYKWSEIGIVDWDKIVPDCNAPGGSHLGTKNPFLCKNMYGMKTMYGYYVNSDVIGVQTIALTHETAKEIKRISSLLRSLKLEHTASASLEQVEKAADDVIELASKGDRKAFAATKAIFYSCLKCHAN